MFLESMKILVIKKKSCIPLHPQWHFQEWAWPRPWWKVEHVQKVSPNIWLWASLMASCVLRSCTVYQRNRTHYSGTQWPLSTLCSGVFCLQDRMCTIPCSHWNPRMSYRVPVSSVFPDKVRLMLYFNWMSMLSIASVPTLSSSHWYYKDFKDDTEIAKEVTGFFNYFQK